MKDLKTYLNEKFDLDGERIYGFSKHKLEDLKKTIQDIINEKYPHRKGRLLWTKSKCYPNDIYEKIVEHFKLVDDEIALAVEIEGIEGPRISDVLRLKPNDADFIRHRLKVYNHKENRLYEVPMAQEIEKELKEFIQKHSKNKKMQKIEP